MVGGEARSIRETTSMEPSGSTRSSPLEGEAFAEKFANKMPTKPEIEQVGAGRFRVRGVLFHLATKWEVDVTVEGPEGPETATLTLDPRPRLEIDTNPTERFSSDELRTISTFSPESLEVPPSPTNDVADDPDAAHLGQFLFFDERLSEDESVSCASCHAPDRAFTDGQKLSQGIGETPRHAPTVLNAAFNRWQFWDGRVDSLWAQALQPFEGPKEHGTDRTAVVRLVAEDSELERAYEEVFGELPADFTAAKFPEHARPVPSEPDSELNQRWRQLSEEDRLAVSEVYANLGKAIAAYERRLVRMNAPFDRFVDGVRTGDSEKLNAISESAKRGLQVFIDEGACDLCHTGSQFTNSEFHTLGLGDPEWLSGSDEGRLAGARRVLEEEFNARGPFSDDPDSTDARRLEFLRTDAFPQKGAFKTPTLRNIDETAPYMHGGHHQTLREVVEFYSDLQKDPPVGRRDPSLQPVELTDRQIDDLVAFLKTLTGEPLPPDLKQQPDSPVPP